MQRQFQSYIAVALTLPNVKAERWPCANTTEIQYNVSVECECRFGQLELDHDEVLTVV